MGIVITTIIVGRLMAIIKITSNKNSANYKIGCANENDNDNEQLA